MFNFVDFNTNFKAIFFDYTLNPVFNSKNQLVFAFSEPGYFIYAFLFSIVLIPVYIAYNQYAMKKNSEEGILYVKNKINKYLFVYIFVFLFLLFILLILNYQENINFSSNSNLAYFNIDIARAVFVALAICVLCLIRTANISTNFDFPEYYFFYFVACFASYLMLGADNLVNFFLLLELQALLFYLLSAVSGPLKNKSALGSSTSFSVFNSEAALKYFIIGSFASAILFFALSLIYLELGSLSLSDIKVLLSVLSQNESMVENMFLYKISFTVVVLVLLYKSAAAPFHVASPEIYEGAPLATTIIYTTIPNMF